MNYIIFKADGSINEKKLAYYIQQGNTGVDTIFVSKADIEDEGSYTCQAFFKLPNGTTNTLAGVWTASVEYKTGVFANGWVITLTTNQTAYNGLLQMSVSLLLSSSNLLTYPVALVINETGYQPDADSGVTIEEINSYLVQLQSYQLKYDLTNVRGYNSLALAEADDGLVDGQIVIIRDGGSSIYQVQAGELVDLIVNKATSDSLGNVIKDSYVSAVYPTYNSTTDKLFIETYSVEDALLANNEVILPKATTTKNGLMAKEDKVKLNDLPTTYETIVNSDAKIKDSGTFTDVADAFNQMSSLQLYKFSLYIGGITYPHFAIRSGTNILDLSSSGIKRYYKSGTTWTLDSTFATQEWANTQLATKQSTSQKGQPNGYASLDSGGKVPTAQLPSYVDDVLEFANLASFPATGSASVIYVALDTNLTYRWSGSAYVEISPSLALGETAETAYRGDKGKTAYEHSQLISGNPHNVTKADIGLDNVINPNAYNNIDISTDLDTIAISGIYTCYGTANGVPSADYSWFIVHLNSGVGTTYAKQVAFAYDGKIYVRFKNTTWGSWAFIPASTLGFDKTVKNILTATNLQEAVDELAEKTIADDFLSDESENPVENKKITNSLIMNLNDILTQVTTANMFLQGRFDTDGFTFIGGMAESCTQFIKLECDAKIVVSNVYQFGVFIYNSDKTALVNYYGSTAEKPIIPANTWFRINIAHRTSEYTYEDVPVSEAKQKIFVIEKTNNIEKNAVNLLDLSNYNEEESTVATVTQSSTNIGYLDITNGVPVSTNTRYRYTDYLPVRYGQKLIISEAAPILMCFYDKYYNFLYGIDNGGNGTTFFYNFEKIITDLKVYYVRINCRVEVSGNPQTVTIQKISKCFTDKIVPTSIPVSFNNVFEGKSYCSFGDSITWYDGNGYIGYQRQLISVLKLNETFLNKGVSGASIATTSSSLGYTPIVTTVKATSGLSAYDLITIFGGTNDFKMGSPMGTIGQIGDTNFDETTFYGACRSIIEYILVQAPDVRIVLITPLQRNKDSYNSWNTENTQGLKLADYVEAIKKLGEMYSLPVVDLFAESGFNNFTLANFTIDGLHPNNKGYVRVGNCIAGNIIKYGL